MAEECKQPGFFSKLRSLFSKEKDPLLEEIYTAAEMEKLLKQYYPSGLPQVSIISVLYRKAYAVPVFLEAVFRQGYAGPIEIVFVGDQSPDHSIATARKTFKQLSNHFKSRPHPITMRLFTNTEKLGNCRSLNVGLEKAMGDIVIFADADCLFNNLFIGHHVLGLAKGPHDISTGPGLKQTEGSTPAKELLRYEKKPELMLQKSYAGLSGSLIPSSSAALHVYCDCKTHNFCAKRNRLPFPLFDEALSIGEGKGACVEGADMGQLLADNMGLGLTWTPGAFSLRLIEPPLAPETEEDDIDL